MGWPLTVLTVVFALTATAVAQGQNSNQQWCQAACKVAPANAPPPGCDCETLSLASEEPATPIITLPVEADVEARQVPAEATSCALACSADPLTAPEECDCTGVIPLGGGVGAGGNSGGISAESITADGTVTIRELLDYMEQVYRTRIEEVQQYYFFERMVVASPPQAAVFEPEVSFMLASDTQSTPQTQQGATGVSTVTPIARNFKVSRDSGRPMVEPATRLDVNTHRVQNDPKISERATADEQAAVEALAQDPALLLEALSGLLGEEFGGGDLQEAADDMRASFDQDAEQAKEDFAEDVLGELLGLKQALDASGAYAKEGQLWAGYYIISPGHYYMRFERVTRCASVDGCNVYEFDKASFELYALSVLADGDLEDKDIDYGICLIWRPPSQALASFQLGAVGQSDATGASVNAAQLAELWLALSPRIQQQLFKQIKDQNELNWSSYLAEEPGWKEKAKQYEQQAEKFIELDESHFKDRPLRMRVRFASNSGLQDIDRIYTKFRSVGPMFEPHRIREKFTAWACGEDSDQQPANKSFAAPSNCGSQPPSAALIERIRSRFTYNQGYARAEEENQAIIEGLGILPGMLEPND